MEQIQWRGHVCPFLFITTIYFPAALQKAGWTAEPTVYIISQTQTSNSDMGKTPLKHRVPHPLAKTDLRSQQWDYLLRRGLFLEISQGPVT